MLTCFAPVTHTSCLSFEYYKRIMIQCFIFKAILNIGLFTQSSVYNLRNYFHSNKDLNVKTLPNILTIRHFP